MSTNAVNRAAFIQEAVKRGKSPDDLARMSTISIAYMLQDEASQKAKPAKPQDTIRQVQEKIRAQTDAEDADETKTVVDMSYMTEHTNPADQKYARFQFLGHAKKDLLQAIKQNTTSLQVNLQQLDEDDVQIVKKEIAEAQARLQSVNVEMAEIHQWFQEIHTQRQVFYQQFLQNSTDVTGDMKTHFQRKLDNIQRYMQAIQMPSNE